MNHKLKKKLDDLETCMGLLEIVRRKMEAHGFYEQANHADSLGADINYLHLDTIEAEGPLFEREEK